MIGMMITIYLAISIDRLQALFTYSLCTKVIHIRWRKYSQKGDVNLMSYGSTDRQFMMRHVAALLVLSNTHTYKQRKRGEVLAREGEHV